MRIALEGIRPTLGEDCWVADSANIIGRVTLGARASVWFQSVVRGDQDEIIVGSDTNIQDGSVLHTDAGIPLSIGDRVTVGHQVMLHGCSVGDESLIGIGSVVLNGASIGRHSLVGARALITEGKSFPERSLILGAPAKVVRELSDAEVAGIRQSAKHYVENAARYRTSAQSID